MKSGPLTNIEKYCIQGMLSDNKTLDDISNELDRKPQVVDKYIKKLEHSVDQIIVNKTGKGNKGVTVMTQVASERGDAMRDKLKSVMSESAKNSLHRIK